MKNITIGFLLLFLEFNLNFGRVTLNVLPDFVGYWMLLQGMAEMKSANPRFESPRTVAKGMLIYTAILWVGRLLGISGGVLISLLSLVALAAHFYIAWVLVKAVRELEQWREADLYGAVLAKRWKTLLGLNVALQLLRLLMLAAPMDVLGMVAAVLVLADIVWAFLFVLGWNRCGKLYDALTRGAAQAEATAESEPAAAEAPAEETETPCTEEQDTKE